MILSNLVYGNMCIGNTESIFYCQYLIRYSSIAGAVSIAEISKRSSNLSFGQYSKH